MIARDETRAAAKIAPGLLMPQGRRRAEVITKRRTYDTPFKLHVVAEALRRPPNKRIKPTCALFPGIEPCQARANLCCPRKWDTA